MTEKIKIQNWADELDDDLPQSSSRFENGVRIETEYKIEDGKKVEYQRHYKVEKVRRCKDIVYRREWRKFGAARDDAPGPNPANTNVCEDVQMQFLLPRTDEDGMNNGGDLDQNALSKTIPSNTIIKCRLCDLDHWTTKCPYKGQFESKELTLDRLGETTTSTLASSSLAAGAATAGKYVPPSLRDSGKRAEGMSMSKPQDYTVRITNLPEEIQDHDIKELFSNIGDVSRIYLARDKITGQFKGFAFVSFRNKADAAKAIQLVNGFGYANLILSVEWAKPSIN